MHGMTSIAVGGVAAVGFLAFMRIGIPLLAGAGKPDFATPFALSEAGYALLFGLVMVLLLEVVMAVF